MNNHNWVCFDCRAASRRAAGSEPMEVPCPKCGSNMDHISDTIRVPPKRDTKAWESLRKWLGQERRSYEQRAYQLWIRRRHDLEQQVERLAAMPPNEGRRKSIRQLRKTLRSL